MSSFLTWKSFLIKNFLYEVASVFWFNLHWAIHSACIYWKRKTFFVKCSSSDLKGNDLLSFWVSFLNSFDLHSTRHFFKILIFWFLPIFNSLLQKKVLKSVYYQNNYKKKKSWKSYKIVLKRFPMYKLKMILKI